MVICFEGKMGTGKTSLAVRYAKELYDKRLREHKRKKERLLKRNKEGYIKKPGLVYTNMRSLTFANKYIYRIRDLISIVNGVVVLDEGHIWFLSRDWRETGRDVIAWFAQSRKRNVDVIYTVQHLGFIDSSIRRITDYVYRCCKIGHYSLIFRRVGFDLDKARYKFAGIKKISKSWKLYDHREVIIPPFELYGGDLSYEEYKDMCNSIDYRNIIYEWVHKAEESNGSIERKRDIKCRNNKSIRNRGKRKKIKLGSS